jgi:hypothetical protein
MKSRILLLIAAAALVTLSFTFVGVKAINNSQESVHPSSVISEPAGGLVIEESL